jgi:hypothetical protein
MNPSAIDNGELALRTVHLRQWNSYINFPKKKIFLSDKEIVAVLPKGNNKIFNCSKGESKTILTSIFGIYIKM